MPLKPRFAVYYHVCLTGATNSRAKSQLGFVRHPLLWNDGQPDVSTHVIDLGRS